MMKRGQYALNQHSDVLEDKRKKKKYKEKLDEYF